MGTGHNNTLWCDKHLYLTSFLNAHNHNTFTRLPQTDCTARKMALFIISQDRQTQVLAAIDLTTTIITQIAPNCPQPRFRARDLHAIYVLLARCLLGSSSSRIFPLLNLVVCRSSSLPGDQAMPLSPRVGPYTMEAQRRVYSSSVWMIACI